MNFADLKPGQVYLLDSPKRIVRVDGPAVAKIPEPQPDGRVIVAEKAAFTCTATTPFKAIPGFVSNFEAAAAEANRNSVTAGCAHDGKEPDLEWTEVWTDRTKGKIVISGGAAKVSRKNFITQLYVQDVKGRLDKRERVSPIKNRAVEGKLIPAELVPAGMFGNEVEVVPENAIPVETEPESAVEVVPAKRWVDNLGRKQLQALAKSYQISAGQKTEVLRDKIFVVAQA